MTRVISVANSKGGVGKSTVTILLAAALAKQKKKKILIMDTDSQETVSKWFETQKNFYESEPLVEVIKIGVNHVQMYLQRIGKDYDIIFIDVPRMTEGTREASNAQLLYYCDSILIPVLGGRFDVMSTQSFYEIVKDAEAKKKELDYDYTIYAFMNRVNTRSDNYEAKEIVRSKLNIPMLDEEIRDLKLFTTPSLFASILDSKKGKERFEPFFNEVIKKLKIK